MFWHVCNKEIRNHLQTFTFGAALVTMFALILSSAWVLGEDFNRRQSTYNTLSEIAAQNARDMYIPSRIEPVVHKPPTPLSIFAQGEEKRLGNSMDISRWEVPTEASESLTDNMLLSSRSSFDLVAVYVYVISLFGLLMSYNAITGERERGTLKLLATYPASRAQILAAKAAAACLTLAIPLLLSLLSALLVLTLVHGIVFTPGHYAAISLMVLAGIAYGGLYSTLGLLTSSLVSRSSSSLVLSLLIWVVSVLLLPYAASGFTRNVMPLKSPTEITDFLQKRGEEVRNTQLSWRRENAPRAGSGMGSWNIGGERPYMFDSWPEAFEHTEQYVRFYENLRQDFAEETYQLKRSHILRKQQQAGLFSMLSALSPAYQVRTAMTALAGTDYAAHAAFLEKARRYRTAFLNGFEQRGYFGENALGLFSRRTREEITQQGWDARSNEFTRKMQAGGDVWELVSEENFPRLSADHLPVFSNTVEKPRFLAAALPLAFLIILPLILFSISSFLFMRYDVR